MVSRNMTGYRMLVAAVLSIIIFQVPAIAQLDEAERLVYLAKAIKRIVVKQIDTAQPQDESKAEVERSFECKAYDKDGKEVDISSDQASKLYKWTVKDSAGTAVDQKGIIEQLESAKDKTRKVQNVLKLVLDKGQKAAKLEVRLADQFSTYSSAVGKSSIAMGKGGTGVFKSIGQWIGMHPYWTTAGAVAVAGGGVAVASGGGGSSNNGSSGGGGNTGNIQGTSAFAGHIAGSISGSDNGTPVSGTFSWNIAPNGSIAGTFSTNTDSGTMSGSVSENGVVSASGSGGGVISGNLTVSGGHITGSGSWSGSQSSGSWSGGN